MTVRSSFAHDGWHSDLTACCMLPISRITPYAPSTLTRYKPAPSPARVMRVTTTRATRLASLRRFRFQMELPSMQAERCTLRRTGTALCVEFEDWAPE